jgi:tetratricopeptide (TPR) repeat protein
MCESRDGSASLNKFDVAAQDILRRDFGLAGSQEDTAAVSKGSGLPGSPLLGREPVTLALLSVLAVVLFLAVSGLSRLYHAQRDALGNRWFARGVDDLNAQRFDRAVQEFRSALLYSRDDFSYQLDLAEALLGMKRTGEAQAYLTNLWDRQPENGLVNLELARIAGQQRQSGQALRYYNNAIYATWPGDEEARRRETRVELIDFLLSIDAKTQAQSELIALAAEVGSDPEQQAQLGDLFVRIQDYEHALAAYRASLKSDHHDGEAEAGAGLAAFRLGEYALAQKYLQVAAAARPEDAESASLLKTAELVLQMDPFQHQISAAQRSQLVVAAFETAGERLKACSRPSGPAAPAWQQELADSWAKMESRISVQGLQRDQDLAEKAMELAFNIERQTSAICGTPAGPDLALLLISKLHEGI